MSLRVLAWRPGRVWQVPFLRASFWRGLYFPIQMHLRTPAVRVLSRVHDASIMYYVVCTCGMANVMEVCVTIGLKHVFS